MEIRLNDRQVAELEKVERAIGALQGQHRAMIEMVLAGADVDPQPVRFDRRPDGVYLVPQPPSSATAE